MAALDLASVFDNPVRLVIEPTSSAAGTSYPYGGTAVGAIRRARWSWGFTYERNKAEEWGEVNEVRRLGEVPIFAFTLDQWDEDVKALLFPKLTTVTGGGGATNVKRIDGGYGPSVQVAMPPLLVAPYEEKLPAFYVRRPVLILEVQEALELAVKKRASLGALSGIGTRPSDWATVPPWQVGPLDRLRFS